MDGVARVRHYREQALSAAAIIAARATSRVDGDSRLRSLEARQDDMLPDLVHDFAFKARKLIELAEQAGIAVRSLAEQSSIAGVPMGSSVHADEVLETYSLWFILGRIIHSRQFAVERGNVPTNVGDTVIYHEAPWGFVVQSDRDAPDRQHFVFIEFLLEQFLTLDQHLESALALAASPGVLGSA